MMIAVNAMAIALTLRPLGRAREALGAVRRGEAETLSGAFPPEIEPLANEINALIDNNRRIVDRSRVQVGDLAHALKTPLAVITNEAGAKQTSGTLIRDQAQIMRRQIDHYLQRARFAAQKGTIAYRADSVAVIERLVRVFVKLNPHLAIEFTWPGGLDKSLLIFAGEAQDLEDISGNLLENAAKWAKSRVALQLTRKDDMLVLTLDDDGPGIAPERREEALRRGRRLDETKPGTGLGLSIVAELVREYRGRLELLTTPGGGLRVVVALPAASQ
jgi:signal transduction histidine kinase